MEMPKILICNVVDCSYNLNRKCRALAITVGDPQPSCEDSHPACDTYTLSSRKGGGGTEVIAGVGACKVDCCEFNDSLECAAPGISVALHSDHAFCETFKMK